MESGRMGDNLMYMEFGKEECCIILIANPLIVTLSGSYVPLPQTHLIFRTGLICRTKKQTVAF